MRRFIGTRSAANYRSAVAALQRIAPLDPPLLRLPARALARGLLPRNLEPLTYAFEELLGESAASARRLIHDWFFYRQLEAASWTGDARQERGVLLDSQHVGDYVNGCARGVIVATVHLGNYLEGLRRFRLTLSNDKHVFVVRRAASSEVEQRAFGRIVSGDLALTVLRVGSGAAARAIRELRSGNIVIVLYDVPRQFGRTAQVTFFGRRAHFVRGPAELALLGNADVLPIFTHYDARGLSVTHALPAIPAPSSGGRRTQQAADLTQRLCTYAERQIRAYPSQWAHWTLVPDLLADGDGAASS